MTLKEEQIEQIKVFDWIRQCTDLPAIHIANERKCNPQQGSLLKRMGVRPGVSDIFIPRAILKFHGTFIELKTKKGKPTLTQLVFLQDMAREEYFTMVCYGADEAIQTIKALYEIP